MKILLNLIGEQPIPNLLPHYYYKPNKTIFLFTETTQRRAKQLKQMINGSETVEIYPYDFNKTYSALEKLFNRDDEIICNITGGTKIMSVALFQLALLYESKIMYLKSEGNNSSVYEYRIKDDSNLELNIKEMPELINLETYIKAHIPHYYFDKKESKGKAFEKAIASVLERNGFEVMQNIRPKGEGDQLEIDLALRLKGTNNVGVAEIKIGDKREEGPKKGIDQLALASQREYLGTFTKRFLITSRTLSKEIKELARAHRIIIIDGLETERSGYKLTNYAENRLINVLKEKLS